MEFRRPVELMDLPNEVLGEIARFVATPLDDSTPLDQNNHGGVKALSMVNRTLREICLQTCLRHVRMWKNEDDLARRLREIYHQGQHILQNSTSISIRSIGYALDAARDYRTKAPEKVDFLRDFTLVLSSMPKLREMRLVSENGRHGIEPVLRKFFNPRKIMFPAVKSLYIRTVGPVSRIFRCFPNLKAINFNLHGSTGNTSPSRTLSQDIKILTGSQPVFQHLSTLAIYKSAGKGWTKEDITAVVGHFPNIERLFLQGCLGSEISDMLPKESHRVAELFARSRNLRYLGLTDELYVTMSRTHHISRRTAPAFPFQRWETAAEKFFAILPGLVEFCMIRQADFTGSVFHPQRDNGDDADGDAGRPGVPVETVRRYFGDLDPVPPRPRLNFPPCRWNGDMVLWSSAWGPLPPRDYFGVPDEGPRSVQLVGEHNGVHFRGRAAGLPVVLYPEMVLDHCETGPWDVEWLRVIRALR
ncbi:hypothetical protein C7999DRAFT_13627 [Corynascus novoguineensis]|uniref:Uncharacterized protein n=1 Tax=Corynascus novoguineensis TaxID=1126955 RepID=A0AAN7HG41_9PEZI|nr:hypothetical protein C7999DRAFT_13627 [Corynascus novoguineensis]